MPVKPSKAAYDLGKQIREKYIAANPAEYREEVNQDIAGIVQSALADLLKRAEIVATECSGPSHMLDEFTAAIEPWKDGK